MWHGCALVASKYPLRSGTGDILQYSADLVNGLGFTATMSYVSPSYATDYIGQNWTPNFTPTTFKQQLQATAYAYVFSLPFTRHFFQVWTYANGTGNPYQANLTPAQLAAEYQEVYDGCVYLLSNFSDKEFILKNWEGDWQLLGDFDASLTIPPTRVERYAAFANIRMKAVHDAQRDTPSTCRVLYAVEMNRCLDDYGFRILGDVLKLIKPDMVGWSAYEAIDDWTGGWVREAQSAGFQTPTNDIRGFAAGNGIYVVVGTGGELSSSTGDCTLWTSRSAGFAGSDILGVCWSGALQLFIAVGTSGKVATSPDAETWTQRTSGTANTLTGVVVDSGGKVVAYGASSTLIYSTDGINWAPVTWVGSAPTTDFGVGICGAAGKFCFGGTSGGLVTGTGATATDASSGAGLSSNTVNALTTDGNRYVAGADGGILTTSGTGLSSVFAAHTSQFSSDGILSLAYGAGTWVAVGTSGKISSSADGLTWVARTSGTGAYLRAVTYSTTEGAFAYGCDGATGYSLDGQTWIVNGQGALGGAIIYHMLSADGMTLTGSNDNLITTAKWWHVQMAAEDNTNRLLRKGFKRIQDAVAPGTPIAITEYGYPQEQSNFTGIGLDVGRLIQKVVDVGTAIGLAGLIWWQILDNEEQSPGVPRGFCLYDRNGNSTTAGSLNAAGLKYDSIL